MRPPFSIGLAIALVCFPFFARGANEALEDAKRNYPDAFGDVKKVPDTMKDIPLAPQNPEDLAIGLKKLKAMLSDKDNEALKDPEVAAKLEMLTAKLKELGVEDILEDYEEPSDMDKHIACVAMAVMTAGSQKQSTIEAMRLVGRGLMTPEIAGRTVLWRLAATCVNHITPGIAHAFKSGKHKKLPQAYVDASTTPGEEFAAEELDQEVWHGFRITAKRLIKKMDPDGEDADEDTKWPLDKIETAEKPKTERPKTESPKTPPKAKADTMAQDTLSQKGKMPIYFGLLMAIPLLGIFGFLGKVFLSMSKDATDKKSKKKEKKTK